VRRNAGPAWLTRLLLVVVDQGEFRGRQVVFEVQRSSLGRGTGGSGSARLWLIARLVALSPLLLLVRRRRLRRGIDGGVGWYLHVEGEGGVLLDESHRGEGQML